MERDPARNTYENVKARFELWNFEHPQTFRDRYVWISKQDDEPQLFSKSKFFQFHRALKYYKLNKRGEWKQHRFITRWIDDENKRVEHEIPTDGLTVTGS